MTLAAITTLPKTTHNTSTLNTGKTSSNYSVKLSFSPHKSSHGTFLDSLTVDWFKIPDVNQRMKRRHTAPAFKTIFYVVFDLVRSQHEFPSRRVDFNPRSYFVRQKTCHCQQQSSQYAIFRYQARDQSFTRVARNETKYEKILDAADFARRENCSFVRLNDAFQKTLLKQPKNSTTTHYESRVQFNMRANFKLTYRENYGKLWKTFLGGRGGGRLIPLRNSSV